jgi:acyl-CoA synthetase (AMP-forming)/AMP-acid ligase II
MTPTEPACVFAAFETTARRDGNDPFLVVPASACRGYAGGPLSYTYNEALEHIRAYCAAYRAAGFGAGHRVALLLENRPAFFFHWFALNALGASVVPINPAYRSSELSYLLGHSEAVLAVVLRERATDVRSAASEADRNIPIVSEDTVLSGLPGLSNVTAGEAPHQATECALLYTSGTTGRPKGCMLSNDYFLRMGLRYLNRGGPIRLERGRSRILTPLPMFHMNAMAGSTMGIVMSGSCLIQLDRFHPSTWWSDVANTRATGIHYLGVMPAILLARPASEDERQHQVCFGVGANVEPEHHAAFERRFGFPLIEGWAMTETGAGGAIGADDEPRHVGTRCFGRLPPTVELRLADDAGRDVPCGEPGEILVRHSGPDKRLGFFSGYLKDPEATEAAWTGGWFHTGDVASMGPDGSLHFVDRKKNIIRRSGENISAMEIEAVLQQHSAVRLVAVAAVRDEIRGEEVMACIVAEPGAATTSAAAQEIVDWSLQRLAYYKAPGWVAFVPGLPTTATQKILRGEMRALTSELMATDAAFDLRSRKRYRQSA